MRTQAKHLLQVVQARKTVAIEFANQAADMQGPAPQARHVAASSYCSRYKGYRLSAHARPANIDLYAADLVIEHSDSSPCHFRALDYFYTAAEALGYATRWGRIWVDHRLQKVVERAMGTDIKGGGPGTACASGE
jgi:hypothetical protein